MMEFVYRNELNIDSNVFQRKMPGRDIYFSLEMLALFQSLDTL